MSNKGQALGKAIKNKMQKDKHKLFKHQTPIFAKETEQNDEQIKKDKMKSVL